jgi:hypothetical protein
MSVEGEIIYQADTSSANSWTSEVLKDDYHLHWFHLKYTSTATVGNRQIRAELIDQDGNVVYDISAGAVQAASNTYHYSYLPGIYRETSFIDNEIQVPFPIYFVAKANHRLRIRDVSDVDAADSIEVNYSVEKL